MLVPAVPALDPAGNDGGSGRDAGDVRELAVRLGPGAHAGRASLPLDGEDWYELPFVAGWGYVVWVSPNVRAELLRPSGDAYWNDAYESYAFAPDEGGLWLLHVTPKDLSADYAITFQEFPSIPQNDAGIGGDASGSVSLAPLLADGRYRGFVDFFDSSDTYMVALRAGETLTATLAPDAHLDARLAARWDDLSYDDHVYDTRHLAWTASEPGHVFVSVYVRDGFGEYDLTLARAGGVGDPPAPILDAALVALLPGSGAMAPRPGGGVFVTTGSAVHSVDADGASSVVGPARSSFSLARSGDGHLYRRGAWPSMGLVRMDADGGATPVTDFGIGSLAFGPDGYLYTTRGPEIVRVAPDRSVSVVSAPGYSYALAFSPSGELYASHWSNGTVSRIDIASGAVTRVARFSGCGEGIAFDAAGRLYMLSCFGHLTRFDPETGRARVFARGVAGGGFLAGSGTRLYVSEEYGRVLQVETGAPMFEGFAPSFPVSDVGDLAVGEIREVRPPLADADVSEKAWPRTAYEVEVVNDGPGAFVGAFTVSLDREQSVDINGLPYDEAHRADWSGTLAPGERATFRFEHPPETDSESVTVHVTLTQGWERDATDNRKEEWMGWPFPFDGLFEE